jgi:hypothetical protein
MVVQWDEWQGARCHFIDPGRQMSPCLGQSDAKMGYFAAGWGTFQQSCSRFLRNSHVAPAHIHRVFGFRSLRTDITINLTVADSKPNDP